jgi:amino acid transporter
VFGEDDFLNRSPRTGKFKQLAVGLVFPAAIVLFSIWCLFHGRTPLPTKGNSAWVSGYSAVMLAFAYMAGAAYMHFRYHWDWSERLEPHSRWPKIVSLTIFITGVLLSLPGIGG